MRSDDRTHGLQVMPCASAVRAGLDERGLHHLDDTAKARFLRVMKKHKYIFDDEPD